MALGNTHRKLNFIIAWPIGLFILFYTLSPHWYYYLIYTLAFGVNTLILNPDLDLAHKVSLKTWRGFLHLPFYPYGYFFSHRGISHSLTLGTLSRALYIIFLCILVILLTFGVGEIENFFLFLIKHGRVWVLILATFYYADLFHLFVDKISDRFS
jgi:uncharacterized metal-binding protein